MHLQPRIVPRSFPGHGKFLWGHVDFTRFQIILLGLLQQCDSMWSIDLVVPHVAHRLLSATLGMRFQYSPILNTSCIVLYRNWLILYQIGAFLMLSHIVASVSSFPVICSIASLALWMLLKEDGQSKVRFISRIPLYTIDCISEANLVPWTLKWLGTLRSISFSTGLVAPSFTSLSHCSFPSTLSWPFTHQKVVVAVCLCRR